MQLTTSARALAISAGAAFVTGALVILLGDAISTPSQWTTTHLLTVLTVFGTIAAGHLMHDAVRARHPFATFGFLVLFLSGTGLVVYQSVGRQAEKSDVIVYDAEAANAAIADKSADLAKARRRFDEANAAADDEMTGSRCGRRCNDWKQRATEVKALITQLEGEIAALGPKKPVAPKADKMAEVAALFGADKARAKAILMLMEPFFWTLFFEIGSIVSLGFAFRHRPTVAGKKTIAETFSEADPEPLPPRPRKGKTFSSSNVVRLPSKHPVVAALEKNGGTVSSNRELAALMCVTDGEASKRWQEVSDQLHVTRVGKRVEIALRKTA